MHNITCFWNNKIYVILNCKKKVENKQLWNYVSILQTLLSKNRATELKATGEYIEL